MAKSIAGGDIIGLDLFCFASDSRRVGFFELNPYDVRPGRQRESLGFETIPLRLCSHVHPDGRSGELPTWRLYCYIYRRLTAARAGGARFIEGANDERRLDIALYWRRI